jgi:hypothetical protein
MGEISSPKIPGLADITAITITTNVTSKDLPLDKNELNSVSFGLLDEKFCANKPGAWLCHNIT